MNRMFTRLCEDRETLAWNYVIVIDRQWTFFISQNNLRIFKVNCVSKVCGVTSIKHFFPIRRNRIEMSESQRL